MTAALERPMWTALTTRQAHLALGDARTAVRIDPAYGVFLAAADASDESRAAMAALVPDSGIAVVIEAEPPPPLPGVKASDPQVLWQMVWEGGPLAAPQSGWVDLTEADAPEMFALARLTAPGPFFDKTHRLGDFVGVKDAGGRLLAMAGERMKPPGHTEVSAICTHPDARARGYGAVLTKVVTARILARGETPFLHVFATNVGAIRLYEALGFVKRRQMAMTMLRRG